MQIKVEHTRQIQIGNPIKNSYAIVTEGKLVLVDPSWSKAPFTALIENGKPILISETEKIEEDDLRYGVQGESKYYKVLALPEHFSPEQLQMIVDGKLKDGDKLLVECEYHQFKGGEPDPSGFYIKKTSNHITLHKVEEKMYTKQELNKIAYSAYRYGFAGGMEEHGHMYSKQHGADSFKKWFEQNVK
jgi:hypothetical protein